MTNLLLFPDLPPAPPDARARAEALDVHRSFIVEAPAGSGKTGLLMQRFLRLLALPEVEDPTQVLACTFTRKATGELRDRVLNQLQNAHSETPPKDAFEQATRPFALAVLARDRDLAWGLLDQPNRLNIRTLDSIANEIANSVPLLSGSGTSQSPLEKPESLFAEAARRTMLLLGTPDHALATALRDLLLHRDGNLTNCESLIAEMLQHREQWAPLIPRLPAHLTGDHLDNDVLPRFNRALERVICRALATLSEALPPAFLQSLCTLAAEMAPTPAHGVNISPIAPCAALTGPPAQTVQHLRTWQALVDLILKKDGDYRTPRGSHKGNFFFDIDPTHKAALFVLIDSIRHDPSIAESLLQLRALPPTTYPPNQWRTAKSLFRVLAQALLELQTVFAETGRCDYSEPNLIAGAALRSENSLETLGSFAQVQHLLVDEMQDTSAAQYELLQLLTQRWDGFSQTVFLVGDPKQSIYLFRQARVERFVTTMATAQLGHGPDAIPLGVLRLTANFRSRQQLVTAFNHDFSLVFPAHPDPANPDIVPYTPATPVRSPDPAAGLTWHTHRFPMLPTTKERTEAHRAQTRKFAREIRSIVEHWRAQPPPPGREHWRIAVLVRGRAHLVEVIKVFNEKGTRGPIPYRANEIEQLREREEILDLLALTRALLNPADRTAWLALLRTPWCGLTLVDLHLLAGQDDKSLSSLTILELIATRTPLLSADAQARLTPLHRVLAHALTRRGLLTTPQLIAETWYALGSPAFLTPAALTNAERFFTLLDELTAAGPLSIPILTERLEKLYATPSLAPDAVDLMTIHGAKGLEWDVVLVPSLERAGRGDIGGLLSWLELPPDPDEPSGSLTAGIVAPISAKGDEPKGTRKGHLADWIVSVGKERSSNELKRLFYVACTRAQEHLHLFASPEIKDSGNPSIIENSLLSAAWSAAELPYEATPIPALEPEPIPTSATILNFPTPLALAATADPAPEAKPVQTRTIHRIPLTHIATPALAPTPPPVARQPFDRPEGSFAARVLGNTLHTLFEQLAARIATGTPAPALLTQLPQWTPRITAILRAGGLGPTELAALTPTVLQSLRNTLADPDGQWLLAPHSLASSEIAFTTAAQSFEPRQNSGVRLDRTFLAGPTPHAPGTTHLWIIDWKTAAQGKRSREAFLTRESEQYRPQLENYARRLAPTGYPIRLALYFPTLPALHWWPPPAPPSP